MRRVSDHGLDYEAWLRVKSLVIRECGLRGFAVSKVIGNCGV